MSNTETPDEHAYGKRDEETERDHQLMNTDYDAIREGTISDEDKRERTIRADED